MIGHFLPHDVMRTSSSIHVPVLPTRTPSQAIHMKFDCMARKQAHIVLRSIPAPASSLKDSNVLKGKRKARARRLRNRPCLLTADDGVLVDRCMVLDQLHMAFFAYDSEARPSDVWIGMHMYRSCWRVVLSRSRRSRTGSCGRQLLIDRALVASGCHWQARRTCVCPPTPPC